MPTPTELALQDRINRLQAKRSRFADILNAPPDSPYGPLPARRERRYERKVGRIDRKIGKAQDALGVITEVPPPPEVPPNEPVTQPPPTPIPNLTPEQTRAQLARLMQQYTPPDLAGSKQAQSFYTSGLSRLNAMEAPSFEDMFSRYQTVANREADRQSAAINEAFGARGARYGGDLLRAQGDLRSRVAQDLAAQADQIQGGMEDRRINAVNSLGQFGYNQQQLESQRQRDALAYLFADAARTGGPPPLLAGGSQYASSFGPPNVVVNP